MPQLLPALTAQQQQSRTLLLLPHPTVATAQLPTRLQLQVVLRLLSLPLLSLMCLAQAAHVLGALAGPQQ